MKIKAVDFAFYCVSDLKKSVDFYQKTLGLNLKSLHTRKDGTCG